MRAFVPNAAMERDVTVDAGALRRALDLVIKVADRKSTMPILGMVKLTAKPPEGSTRTGVLTITATDLNVSVGITIGAAVAQESAIAVDPRALRDALDGAEGFVSLRRVTDPTLSVKVVRGEVEQRIIAMSANDFPTMPKFAGKLGLIDREQLAGTIGRTAYAQSSDEMRFHLCGTMVESTGETLRLVTTDGHRLSMDTIFWQGPMFAEAIIPRKGIAELQRAIKKARTVELGVARRGGAHVFARIVHPDGMLVIWAAKLIDRQFPPYDQVIPKNHIRKVVVDRKELYAALCRARKFCSETRGVGLGMGGGDGLVLKGDDPEKGTFCERLATTGPLWSDDEEPTPLRIGVNPKYLIDAVGQMTGAEVEIHTTGELDPLTIKGHDGDDAGFTAVVMPMRI